MRLLILLLIPSLLISDPGDQHFYSEYGHAALRLQDPEQGEDFVFDYVGNHLDDCAAWYYLTEQMRGGTEAIPTELYRQTNRERRIREYPITLSDSMTVALLLVLGREADKGVREPYEAVKGSCCRRLALAMDEAARRAGHPLCYPDDPESALSARELSIRYAKPNAWSPTIYCYLYGTGVEKPSREPMGHLLFPDQLVRMWQGAGIISHEYTIWNEGESQRGFPVSPLAVAIALLTLTLLGCGERWGQRWMRWMKLPLMLFIGLFGTLLWYMWLCTDLPYSDWNMLIPVLNPLMLIGWRWRRWWGIPYALLLVGVLVCQWEMMTLTWRVVTMACCLLCINKK